MGSFFDLVKSRRSVRSFDGRPVDANLMKQLQDYSETVSNPYQIPVTFGFFDAKKYSLSSPVLTGVETYVTAKVKVGANADVAYGYSFHGLAEPCQERSSRQRPRLLPMKSCHA